MNDKFFGLYRIDRHWNMSEAGTYIRKKWQTRSLYFTSAADSVKSIPPKMIQVPYNYSVKPEQIGVEYKGRDLEFFKIIHT